MRKKEAGGEGDRSVEERNTNNSLPSQIKTFREKKRFFLT